MRLCSLFILWPPPSLESGVCVGLSALFQHGIFIHILCVLSICLVCMLAPAAAGYAVSGGHDASAHHMHTPLLHIPFPQIRDIAIIPQ